MTDLAADSRFALARLADFTHKLPMPSAPRLFAVQGEIVDLWDGFWQALLRDGSIVLGAATPAAAADAPVAAPVVEPPAT